MFFGTGALDAKKVRRQESTRIFQKFGSICDPACYPPNLIIGRVYLAIQSPENSHFYLIEYPRNLQDDIKTHSHLIEKEFIPVSQAYIDKATKCEGVLEKIERFAFVQIVDPLSGIRQLRLAENIDGANGHKSLSGDALEEDVEAAGEVVLNRQGEVVEWNLKTGRYPTKDKVGILKRLNVCLFPMDKWQPHPGNANELDIYKAKEYLEEQPGIPDSRKASQGAGM